MTQFLNGGHSLYTTKRPFVRPIFFALLFAIFLLTACNTQIGTTNWPGLSTDGQKVYVAYGPQVIAYDVENERQAWSFSGEPSAAPFYAAPSVQDGRVVIADFGTPGGFTTPSTIVSLYALEDTDSGSPTTLWAAPPDIADASIVASPLQIDDTIYIGTTDNQILMIDAINGTILENRHETGNSVWAQPIHHEGIIYVTSLDKKVYALDADTLEDVWEQPAEFGGSIPSSVVIGDELLYIAGFDSTVHALAIGSGEEQWQFTATDWIWGTPALVDDILYVADQQGLVYALDASTGSEIWQVATGETIQASPVVEGNTVYIASAGDTEIDLEERQGTLIALSIDSGEEQWRETTVAPIYTTPVIVNQYIVVAIISETDLLIGFALEDGDVEWRFPVPS